MRVHKTSLLEHATGATGAAGTGEVVSTTGAPSSHPRRARRQDDGSYMRFFKIKTITTHVNGSNTPMERVHYYPPDLPA